MFDLADSAHVVRQLFHERQPSIISTIESGTVPTPLHAVSAEQRCRAEMDHLSIIGWVPQLDDNGRPT